MVPSLRTCNSRDRDSGVKWIVEDVLLRGRWDNTPALTLYSTYIKVATVSQRQNEVVNREKQANLPSSRTCHEEIQRNGLHTSSNAGVKRSATGSPDQQFVHSRKKSRRDPATVADESESATAKNIPGSCTPSKAGTLYANDGEESGEGRLHRKDRNHEDLQVKDCEPARYRAEETSNAIAKLYETVLIWPIFPVLDEIREAPGHNMSLRKTSGNRLLPRTPPSGHRSNHSTRHANSSQSLTLRERIALHLLTSMEPWVAAHCERYRQHILPDVTNAASLDEYRRHWKAIIPFEVRAMVTECIQNLLPKCKADPTLQFSADIRLSDFVSCLVDNVSPMGKLLNITGRSTNAVLLRRIAKEFQGGTLCVGYIKGEDEEGPIFTGLSLFACRKVSWDEDDVLPMGDTETVDEMKMHLVTSRNRFRDIGIWPGNTLYLLQLCPFAPSLRMYKAVEESYVLPRYIQDVLFGRNFPVPLTDGNVDEKLIDSGCAAYLNGLRESCAKVDKPQLESIRSVIANIGNGRPLASSFSMIHGPPGTGKTTTILYLIGALMNHSQIGHIGEEQMHVLKKRIPADDIVRCRKKLGGVRILVCAPSNKAVGNILEKIHKDGIPDGKGGVMRPQVVRFARTGYDHGDLQMYTLRSKALPFDEHLHNVGIGRKNPSGQAQKSFFQECILVFSTLVLSGGAHIRDSKIPFDVVIIDEIGQASEPEAIIPMVASSKISTQCHVVAVGDHKQLPPVALASFPMRGMKRSLHFNYDKQLVSIFERLYENQRASCRMLTRQYRMCRAVAEMNNHIFYEGRLQSTIPEYLFDVEYNKGWDPVRKSFAKQTFIDTSLLSERREFQEKHEGDYRNMEEVNVIAEVLNTIKRLAGPSFHSLRNEIAVLVPYRSQVEYVRTVLQRYGKYVPHGVSRQGFAILVDSVDSMQGSERDIIIFGCTRSNLEQRVGFLDKPNRLNVATSRARKLQIIIGDLSTLERSKYFRAMKKFCLQRRKDSALLRIHPANSAYLLDGLKEHRETY